MPFFGLEANLLIKLKKNLYTRCGFRKSCYSVEKWHKVGKSGVLVVTTPFQGGDMLFQGTSSLNLDAKGRLAIPARHRDALVKQGQNGLTITRSPEGCLLIYPRNEWEQQREKILQLPMSMQWWKRILVGNALDVDMDGSGRVLVSPELRQAVSLTKEATLLGMGRYLELWDKVTHDAKEAEALSQQIPPDIMNDLVF